MVRTGLRDDALRLVGSARASLIERLGRTLHEAGVSHCHWKSTEGLLRGFKEGDDLDLLVGAGDTARFHEIIHVLGFKKARGPRAREFPGVAHYYALDASSGQLVHLHAYYRLVLGHDATKNYRLPIEDAYLASATHGHVFPIPAPEFELAVLVLRLVLKHGGWDSMLRLEGPISAAERRELDLLTTVADPVEVREVVARHLPFVGVELFEDCLRSVQPEASIGGRIAAARRLQKALRDCAKRGAALDVVLKFWGRGSWVIRRKIDKTFVKKRLESGGTVIAVVGGDGAGKSSTVAELRRWLQGPLRTHTVHLGKPPRSAARLVLKAYMSVTRRSDPGWSDEPTVSGAAALRQVLVARDRARRHNKLRRLATRGELVLCDRYPVPSIKQMDGPRLAGLEQSSSRWARSLARRERGYYDRILPPDVLVVLRVDPARAAARKTEEDADFVRRRSQEVWELDWSDSQAAVVDASQPFDEVVGQVKGALWPKL